MSKNIVLGLALVLTLAGCGNKEESASEDKASIGDAVSAISGLKDAADASEGITKHMEELKKMSPVTNDQLKSVLPDNLGGIARTSFEVSNGGAVGLQMISAKFEKSPQQFKLDIFDGAGEMGSAMYGMGALGSLMGAESETQTGYTKPFSIGDSKGSEKQDKADASNISNEVTLIVADRFMVVASSNGTDMDALKEAIKASNVISKLEAL